MKIISFSIFKKVSKNHDKNFACRYLLEIPFVSQRDNGPLRVKVMNCDLANTLIEYFILFFIQNVQNTQIFSIFYFIFINIQNNYGVYFFYKS